MTTLRSLGILLLAVPACGGSAPLSLGHPDGGDASQDAAADRPTGSDDAAADGVGDDAPSADVGPAPCEAAPAAIVCGCGCCGGTPLAVSCYYPALGQSASDFPDPRPANCANVGCSAGERHVCCTDVGLGSAPAGNDGGDATTCAYDPATDLPRVRLTKVEGTVCTKISLVGPNAGPPSPTDPIPGWKFESGTRGPCDGSGTPADAIGAFGTAALGGPSPGHVDIHLAVFFDPSASAVSAVRVDVQDLTLSISACSP